MDITEQEDIVPEVMSEEDIKLEVTDIIKKETELNELESILSQNEQFKSYLKFKSNFEQQSSELWKRVEGQMIDNKIKNIKGDWGSLTIAERIKLDIDESLLPKKFFKRVADSKLVADTFKLENKAPKGVTVGYTQYLMKRFKKEDK